MKKILLLISIPLLLFACKGDMAASKVASDVGRGGSTARFTIVGNYLYVVDSQSLRVFDIANPTLPVFLKRNQLNTIVETIFSLNKYLFIGTQTGMFIYNIDMPDSPKYVSMYSHVVSCDPVVADKDFAYVTLRNGTACNRGLNALDVIDIRNITQPVMLKSYPMKNPHGLGIDGNLLFVTEGDYGLKVLDRTNPMDIKEIKNFETIRAVDVIPDENTLLVTGKDGIYQYDYSNKKDLKLLSVIPTQP